MDTKYLNLYNISLSDIVKKSFYINNIPIWFILIEKYFEIAFDVNNMIDYITLNQFLMDDIKLIFNTGCNLNGYYNNRNYMLYYCSKLFNSNILNNHFKIYTTINKNMILFLLQYYDKKYFKELIEYIADIGEDILSNYFKNNYLLLPYKDDDKRFYTYSDIFNKKDENEYFDKSINKTVSYDIKSNLCKNIFNNQNGKISKYTSYYITYYNKFKRFYIKCLHLIINILIEISTIYDDKNYSFLDCLSNTFDIYQNFKHIALSTSIECLMEYSIKYNVINWLHNFDIELFMSLYNNINKNKYKFINNESTNKKRKLNQSIQN
jgi:hypothetical protein